VSGSIAVIEPVVIAELVVTVECCAVAQQLLRWHSGIIKCGTDRAEMHSGATLLLVYF